jgi:hypothetical protein
MPYAGNTLVLLTGFESKEKQEEVVQILNEELREWRQQNLARMESLRVADSPRVNG